MGVRRVIRLRADVSDEFLEREVLKRLDKNGDYAGEVHPVRLKMFSHTSFLNNPRHGQTGMQTTGSLVMIMCGPFLYSSIH